MLAKKVALILALLAVPIQCQSVNDFFDSTWSSITDFFECKDSDDAQKAQDSAVSAAPGSLQSCRKRNIILGVAGGSVLFAATFVGLIIYFRIKYAKANKSVPADYTFVGDFSKDSAPPL